MRTRFITLPLLVLALALPAAATEFYVSPKGDDANSGARDAPFQSLERARAAVREHREANGLGDDGITVILREGRYHREQTFELNSADSGEPGAPVVYKAADGEAVYIDGGYVLDPDIFEPVTDEAVLDRLPESARGSVLQADLRAEGISEFGEFGPRGWDRSVKGREGPGVISPEIPAPMELLIDGVPQTVARWPNDDHIRLGEVFKGGQNDSDQPGVFEYNTDRAERWTEAEDLYISGRFGVAWGHDTVGIAEIDTEAGTFTTEHPHHYGFRQTGHSGFTTQYHAVNLLEEIDEPGEYYIDRGEGVLYFLPAHPLEHSRVQVSELQDPFVRMQDASHIQFKGLTFENARGAGFIISEGESSHIIGCTLRALAGRAISINGGEDHGVISSDIYYVGRGGVLIGGGDRASLTPAGHFVRNCDIHHYNRWTGPYYNPAIKVTGVGNRVEHNHMHHGLYQAITFGGNEHVFEFNEIHRVVKDISDQGSIYVGRDPTWAGNVIRHNFFHHLFRQRDNAQGVQAIYFDDDTLYIAKVFGNVFYQTGSSGVIKFHGGGGASIANNIAIQCPQLFEMSAYIVKGEDKPADIVGIERAISKMRTGKPFRHGFPAKIEAMNISEDPYRSRYPYLYKTYAEGYNEGTPRWNNLEVADDLEDYFVDPENLDFSLRDGAAILEHVAEDVYDPVYGAHGDDIPFERIPFEDIGLLQDDHRSELGPLPFRKLGPGEGASGVNAEQTQLWWMPSANADRYRVRIAADKAMKNIVAEEETQRNHVVIDALAPGETYYWQVEAIVDQSRSNRGVSRAEEEPWPFTTGE